MVFTWLLSITFPWGKCSSVNVTVKEVVLYLMGDLSTLFFCWFPVLGRVGSVRLVVFSVRLHTSATTIIFSCAVSYRCCSVFLSFFSLFFNFCKLFCFIFCSVPFFKRERRKVCRTLQLLLHFWWPSIGRVFKIRVCEASLGSEPAFRFEFHYLGQRWWKRQRRSWC